MVNPCSFDEKTTDAPAQEFTRQQGCPRIRLAGSDDFCENFGLQGFFQTAHWRYSCALWASGSWHGPLTKTPTPDQSSLRATGPQLWHAWRSPLSEPGVVLEAALSEGAGSPARLAETRQVQTPCIFVVAGPNGAGKSTTAPSLLRDRFRVQRYLNADTIASGISAFDPEAAAFQAGRIMLQEMHRIRERQETFAFETTLASRSYAQSLAKARRAGYRVGLLFLSLPSVEAALERVARRVKSGGHHIPEDVIRRRFERGLRNFFCLYQSLADRWIFSDNGGRRTKLLAHGGIGLATVEKSAIFGQFKEYYGPR